MRVSGIRSSFVIGMLAVASCTLGVDDDSDGSSGDLVEDGLGSSQQPITKGKAGAFNGSADYCNNAASPCLSGEGDCDSNAQCAPGMGLICVPNNGLKFGFPSNWDVCAAAHCANGVLDGDETAADCGGSCGTCSSCLGTAGGPDFCNGCLCASGQGDCDSSAQCASGLVCGANIGPQFGRPRGYDVCVPPHCTNRVQDAASGETGVDVGGPCGTLCGNGVVNSGETCDDGVNDGVLCSADCSTATEVGQIRWDCDPNAGIITTLSGTDCISFPGTGASYLTLSSSGVQVTLYRNGDCTGSSTTAVTDNNFCDNLYDDFSDGLNDTVSSARVSRL